jgi:hypothetical protein
MQYSKIPTVFLHKPFRTNYVRSKMYHVKTSINCPSSSLKSTAFNSGINRQTETRICSACYAKNKVLTQYREEKFTEPSIYRGTWYPCGSYYAFERSFQKTDLTRFFVTYNDRKLPEKFSRDSTNQTPIYTVEYEFYGN